ncbi:hypothetical protein RUND412_002219 [Rhizina undulata]
MSSIHDYQTLFILRNKTAVVTGGSRGLGLYAATGLLHAGCSTVIINSRKADACATAVRSLSTIFPSATILSIPADLSKPSEVTRFTSEVRKHVSAVHILLANAGTTWGESLETHSDAAFTRVMDLNLRSVFNLIREMTPLLEAGASKEDPSRVITVGSVAGLHIGSIGKWGTYGYAASKAAVMHLTKHLSIELASRNILCNSVAPGFFPTKMADGLIAAKGGIEHLEKQSPNGRLGKEEDIVGAMVYLCSRAGSHINGIVLPIDGGKHLVHDAHKL